VRKIKIIIFIIICFYTFLINVKAENVIYNLDIKATIEENGTMHVVEVWDMYTDEATEVYKEELNLTYMNIVNFNVHDEYAQYDLLQKWNVGAGFHEKKNKYGINIVKNGIELCWGISRYGNNKYTISYDIENAIFNVDDAQVLEKRFINVSNIPPKSFSIEISGPYDYPSNLDVWGYGYKGLAYVKDGKIKLQSQTNRALSSDEYSTVLVKFPLNTFKIDNFRYYNVNTFQDVLNNAEENSFDYDYEQNNTFDNNNFQYDYEDDLYEKDNDNSLYVILIVLFSIVAATFKFAKKTVVKNEKKLEERKYIFEKQDGDYKSGKNLDNVEMYRDIPCDKNIFKAYFISQAYDLNLYSSDFFGSLFLKWLNEDKIKIIKDNKNVLFSKGENYSIKFLKNKKFDTEFEKKLYEYFMVISDDSLLEKKEIERYVNYNYDDLESLLNDIEEYGRDLYVSENLVEKVKKSQYDSFRILIGLKDEAKKVAGLKKFLTDMTNINEKKPIEVKLWKEYLMFAQIFGIAQEVAKCFKDLYPEINIDFDSDSFFDKIDFINDFSSDFSYKMTSYSRAREQRINDSDSWFSDSGKSSSYTSGGGGYSSGGGGGSFGGGGRSGTR